MLKLLKIIAVILSITLMSIPTWATEQEPEDYLDYRAIPKADLDVEVWVNRGDGAVYHPGDNIKVYFKTTEDCYLVIYGIDSRGDVNVLYPYDEIDAPWVEGGKTYRIPDRYDDYDLRISGPEGIEYIRAVASLSPFALPSWPRYSGKSKLEEIEVLRMEEDEDPFEFIQMIDCELVPYCDDYASDLITFRVEHRYPRWYYYPHLYCDRYPWCCNWGTVYFISEPFGAEIWIDGIYYGITPLNIPYLYVGRHYICFYFNGCWVWRDYVYVERDRKIKVNADIGTKYRYVDSYVVKKDYRTKTTKFVRDGKTYATPKAKTEVKNFRMEDRKRIELQDRKLIEQKEREVIHKSKMDEQRNKERKIISTQIKKRDELESKEKIRQKEQIHKQDEEYQKTKREEAKVEKVKQTEQRSTIKSKQEIKTREDKSVQMRTEKPNSVKIEKNNIIKRR